MKISILKRFAYILNFALNGRDKFTYVWLYILRTTVGLLDPIAVVLLGLTVNLLLIGPDNVTPTNKLVYATFNIASTNQAYARLLFLFWLGAFVVSLFVIKGLLSAALYFFSSRKLAHMQARNVSSWAEVFFLTNGADAFGMRDMEHLKHVLTKGAQAVYQRSAANLLTIFTEATLLLATILVLLSIQPWVTLGTLAFLTAFTFLIQKILGRFFQSKGEIIGPLEISSARILRQTVMSFRELRLAGTMHYPVNIFSDQQRSIAFATGGVQAASQLPRYVLETVLVIGAFTIAAYEYSSTTFTAATSIVVIFMAAGSRIVPSLITIINANADMRGASSDVDLTINALESRSEANE